MNHEPRKPDKEQDLEHDLEAMQASWNPLEGSETEPPELVDQAVMNAARRDLERKNKHPLRWLGGFATATVVVVAISVVLQQDPSISEPRSLEKQSDPMAAPPERRLEKSAILKNAQSPLPAAEPRAQTREAKRQRHDELAAPAAAEDPAAKIELAPIPIRAEQFNLMAESAEKQDAKASADTILDESEVLADAAADSDAVKEAPRSAEAWIELMLELQTYGQMKRLGGEIAAFRHYYPDHPLPEQLVSDNP